VESQLIGGVHEENNHQHDARKKAHVPLLLFSSMVATDSKRPGLIIDDAHNLVLFSS
jgi:hypothetical protein